MFSIFHGNKKHPDGVSLLGDLNHQNCFLALIIGENLSRQFTEGTFLILPYFRVPASMPGFL